MITDNLKNNVLDIECSILEIIHEYDLNLDEIKEVFQSLLYRVEDNE
jgi:hypothetical protein